MSNIFHKIKMCFSNLKYLLSSLFWLKDKRIILFGGWFGERFADNTRFLFQYLSDNKKKPLL